MAESRTSDAWVVVSGRTEGSQRSVTVAVARTPPPLCTSLSHSRGVSAGLAIRCRGNQQGIKVSNIITDHHRTAYTGTVDDG